jgi:hypothetical protein
LAYPASLGRLVPAGARSNRRQRLCLHRFGLTQLGGLLRERKVCTAIFGVRVAPAHDEPRSGSNNSERESTSGRSTNYGGGDLIRVFRDIGRIFSLLFLLTHPSPVGQPLRGRGSRNMVSSKAKNGFNCVSCGTHRGGRACGMSFAKTRTPPERFDAQNGGGLGNPPGECFLRIIFCYEGSARAMPGAAKGSLRNVRHEQPIRHSLLEMLQHCCLASRN